MLSGPNPRGRPGRIQRLLVVSDAAVAEVSELPPAVRAVIDAAAEVYVVTPNLPGRLDWLADDGGGNVLVVIADAVDHFKPEHILLALRGSEHANWQERRLVEDIEERFGVSVTTYAVDPQGHASQADGPLLLCYDGSEEAGHAIERAAALFAGRRALVLAVWQSSAELGAFAGLGAAAHTVDFSELDRAAAEGGDRVAEEGVRIARHAGLQAEPLAVKAAGPVWQAIIEVADRYDAATIVLGSRGLTRIRSILLGSVSSAVVHHAERPTLIIRRPSEDSKNVPRRRTAAAA